MRKTTCGSLRTSRETINLGIVEKAGRGKYSEMISRDRVSLYVSMNYGIWLVAISCNQLQSIARVEPLDQYRLYFFLGAVSWPNGQDIPPEMIYTAITG